jgi:gamma-glutamyl:cysteine ligase YbdK (ATP-grasp superfamily)
VGLEIDRDQFEEAEFTRFSERLEQSLVALGELLERPGFGVGPRSLGAELELFLVDGAGRPLPANREVLAETLDPRMTVELDRFNLECNLRHAPLAGRPFGSLGREMEGALAELRRAATAHAGRLAVIGVLPTLRVEDLQSSAMTDSPRYRALSAAVQRLRRSRFSIRIDGAEPLAVECDDVTFEGANTSLQLHLRVDPGDFVSTYNAVQMATGPVLAAAGNSPTFLGHRLWEETRVALFKQAVDERGSGRRRESRVAFGRGWARGGAPELFAENVRRHPPLLPVLGPEDPLAQVRAGGVPRLDEVRLHQGTVWHWNRAIYDPADGGHLRLEMRALPAGPSIVDMQANAAFLIGLALGLAPDAGGWLAGFPFERAEVNFYRAARSGLQAELAWPPAPGEAPEPIRARELVLRLLPLARRGLEAGGVETAESEPLLELVAERVRSGRTGAAWQRETLEALEKKLGRTEALAAMLEHYLKNAESREPVHRWPVAP